jgi:crotonobetainyl-CoA:carnitine CoA-transferase CaiB-like acyl-CoA transferase
VNDVMGGMFGAIAILAALHERAQSGQGQFVQSGLFENNIYLVAQHMMQYAVTGKAAAPMPARLSAWAIYDVFDTADGDQVFVGVVSDSQWKVFCGSFGLADLGADPALAANNQRVHARDRIMPRVRGRLGAMTKSELMNACEKAGLPFAPITKPEHLFDDPHLNGSGGLTDIRLADGRTTKVPTLPFEMNGRRFGARLDPPAPGRHTRALWSPPTPDGARRGSARRAAHRPRRPQVLRLGQQVARLLLAPAHLAARRGGRSKILHPARYSDFPQTVTARFNPCRAQLAHPVLYRFPSTETCSA